MQADEAYALLGCSASDSDGSVRQCFLRAAVREHPDKKPEGLERQAAETRFQQFRSAFDSVMQARSKLAKTAEGASGSGRARACEGSPIGMLRRLHINCPSLPVRSHVTCKSTPGVVW